MTKINSFIFFIFFLVSFSVIANDDLSYVDGSEPFILIKDINRQAEAWGTCSAAYEIMAQLLESTPAQAKKVKDLSNGASLAVVMSHVSDGLTSDITPEKFNALWTYSKTLYDSIPETRRTMIFADAEALGNKGAELFANKISATVKVCINNLEGQQSYIDTWRELAKSGLLKLPTK